MKKSVPMWRALLALFVGVSFTAGSMYAFGKRIILNQAEAYKNDIAYLKARTH